MESNMAHTLNTYKEDTLKRGETQQYCFNEPICSDSEDSDDEVDDEVDDVLKTFQDNYTKLRNYCKESPNHSHKYKEVSDDLVSFGSALDTYNSYALETRLVAGFPWSREQRNSDDGRKDHNLQSQYKIWKFCKKYCNYCSKFKLEKAKECHRKLLELRTDFLEYSSNNSGLVRSTYVKTSELDDELSSGLKYRKNVCDVTLLPATEVYRLVANSMKKNYDNEIEMYEEAHDLRREYSEYNEYMLDKHLSIFKSN
jgi:hypothetical protein